MKKDNLIYWICTILLCLLMGGGAIPYLIGVPEARAMMEGHLHYPHYFGIFISVAKILGSIAILVPGFPKIKEWAYAGFTFDLIGAIYSALAVGDRFKNVAPMFIFFGILIGSYVCHHQRLAAKTA